MKKSHAGLWTGLAVLLFAAVYSAVLFLLKKNFDTSAWILYGFTLAAFVLLFVQITAVSRNSPEVVTDSALGIVTVVYFAIQFIFGGIVCMRFSDLPFVPVVVCEAILLAAYLILAFVVFGAQSHSAAQDRNDQAAVRKHRLLEGDIRTLADGQQDADLKAALEKLAEEFHYSDVVSLPGLADVDGRIARNVAVLQEELENGGSDPLATIETLRKLLRERDRTAAILKR